MTDLQDRVSRIVAQVALEQTGRHIAPAAEEDLIARGYLREEDLPHLVFALCENFEIALEPQEVQPRTLASVAAIAQLITRRSG